MTIASLICLQQAKASSLLNKAVRGLEKDDLRQFPDRDLPIITAKSTFANALTAFETAYLLQDSAVLFYTDKVRRASTSTGLYKTKGLNNKHLAIHHAVLSCAFGTLQWYIHQGREKGVLIIVMLMLMNASSPVQTVRWYLVNFRPQQRVAIALATVSYLMTYATCRVYLVYYVLKLFGAQRGHSALQTFVRLKWQCQLGSGGMALVNSLWLANGVVSFVRRNLRDLMI